MPEPTDAIEDKSQEESIGVDDDSLVDPQEDAEDPNTVFVDEDEEPGVNELKSEPELKKEDEKPGKDKIIDADSQARITQLETEKRNLNVALHQARQERKPKQEAPPETLTPDQIKQLLKEHGDDPEVMYNLVQYIAGQSSREQTNVNELSQLKKQSDNYVYQRWPSMADESSELFQKTHETAKSLRVADHPLGDYLALATLICEELPNIQKQSYEEGRTSALKGKAEKTRKQTIKTNVLTPSGSGKEKETGGELPSEFLATAKQMGMSPSQRKVYATLVSKGQ